MAAPATAPAVPEAASHVAADRVDAPATASADQYVGLAPAYVASKFLPFRTLVERPALVKLWLNVTAGVAAPTALDLACGDGWYSRVLLQELGAAAVHGVDLSPDMIADGSAKLVPGLTLSVGDCTDSEAMARLGSFDVVTAAYLLCYAATEAELTAMMRGAAAALKPGGA